MIAMQNNATAQPLGIMPARGSTEPPLSEEDWRKRKELLGALGFQDDSTMMQGTEWRRGLAERRERFRSDTADSITKALGFKGKDTAVTAAAAKGAGSGSLMSSL